MMCNPGVFLLCACIATDNIKEPLTLIGLSQILESSCIFTDSAVQASHGLVMVMSEQFCHAMYILPHENCSSPRYIPCKSHT